MLVRIYRWNLHMYTVIWKYSNICRVPSPCIMLLNKRNALNVEQFVIPKWRVILSVKRANFVPHNSWLVAAWNKCRLYYTVGCSVGLTASLVSQFFSREFCGKWDSLLAKISVRVSWVSRVSQEGKNAIYCQACESRNLWVSHLQDSQTRKVIIRNKKLVFD